MGLGHCDITHFYIIKDSTVNACTMLTKELKSMVMMYNHYKCDEKR